MGSTIVLLTPAPIIDPFPCIEATFMSCRNNEMQQMRLYGIKELANLVSQRISTNECSSSTLPEFPSMIVGKVGVGVAACEHNVGQGVPAGLDGSEVPKLSVGVRNGSHQGEVGRLVHPDPEWFTRDTRTGLRFTLYL